MKIINLISTDPYLNLAIEEYLFHNSDDDVFMLWQNEPTVVIGKNQNIYAEIDLEYLKDNQINVARRITGGGAVYHDLGNINFSFISTNKGQRTLDFKYFTSPIIDALNYVGLNAELSGRNDILLNDKKISGNAQYSFNGRVLHHGTLLYKSDLSVLSSVLKPDSEKIESKAIKSVRARVANIYDNLENKYNVEEFKKILLNFTAERLSADALNPRINDEIINIYNRNKSDNWIFSDRPLVSKYNITRKKRFPFGTVEIQLFMKNDIIEDARIFGDFFQLASIIELEQQLKGKRLVSDENTSVYSASKYIYGMTDFDFWKLLHENDK